MKSLPGVSNTRAHEFLQRTQALVDVIAKSYGVQQHWASCDEDFLEAEPKLYPPGIPVEAINIEPVAGTAIADSFDSVELALGAAAFSYLSAIERGCSQHKALALLYRRELQLRGERGFQLGAISVTFSARVAFVPKDAVASMVAPA